MCRSPKIPPLEFRICPLHVTGLAHVSLIGLTTLKLSDEQLKPTRRVINTLAHGIFFKILAHPVFKMWILQEPKKIALWNKRQLEEKKTENVRHV